MFRALLKFPSRLRKDKRGVSAIEFALIAPAMVATFCGIGEVQQWMLASSRNTNVASTVADLVTQATAVNTADITNIFDCAKAILQPFDSSKGWVRVTSIVSSPTGVTTVAWSDARGTTARTAGSAITVPAGVVAPNTSVILAETQYTYTSTFGMFLTGGITNTTQFYAKPRRSLQVQRL